MAVRYIDGFDDYATADITAGNWNQKTAAPAITTGGRNGGNCMTSSSGSNVIKAFPDTQQTWIIGGAFKFTTGNVTNYNFIHLGEVAGAQIGIGCDVSGYLTINRSAAVAFPMAGSFTNLGTYASPISFGTWYYIEFKVTISNDIAAGSCILRVNGVDVITLAIHSDTQYTANSYASMVAIGSAGGAGPVFICDDVYILDNTGSTNNDFLGDVRVDSLLPTGNGATSNQWTASTGTNASCVDEVAPNSTDYVSDTTAGHIDTYAMGNLATTANTIFAVQTGLVTIKTDAGNRTIAPVIVNADGTKVGTTVPVYDSYFNNTQVYEQNPLNTPAAWTEATVNGIEFGAKLIA